MTTVATAAFLFILPVGMVLFVWWILWVLPAEQVRVSFEEDLEEIRQDSATANRAAAAARGVDHGR
jgi:hypothetical protein